MVNYGASQDFNAAPSTGYQVDKWTLDGNDVQSGGNTYTLSNVTTSHEVGVTFKILTYMVTATAGTNGRLSRPACGQLRRQPGLNATPSTGYQVDKWTLDGNDVQSGGNTYTLSNITADHAVGVTFRRLIFAISGYVFELDGNTAVEGVLIQADNDINSVTDANGYYEL